LANVVKKLQAPYNASKAAVKHLAASLGVEWAEHGVRVNALRSFFFKKKKSGLTAEAGGQSRIYAHQIDKDDFRKR